MMAYLPIMLESTTGTATFTRFSGRFGNTSQTLSLSGLSAGQTYTLDFDLYAIDSWEGNGLPVSYAPDVFKVIIDGLDPGWVTVMRYQDFAWRDVPEAWLQRDYLPRYKPS